MLHSAATEALWLCSLRVQCVDSLGLHADEISAVTTLRACAAAEDLSKRESISSSSVTRSREAPPPHELIGTERAAMSLDGRVSISSLGPATISEDEAAVWEASVSARLALGGCPFAGGQMTLPMFLCAGSGPGIFP
jgi:hypothetical protein